MFFLSVFANISKYFCTFLGGFLDTFLVQRHLLNRDDRRLIMLMHFISHRNKKFSNTNTLDLHGLFVKEALEALQGFLMARENGKRIICYYPPCFTTCNIFLNIFYHKMLRSALEI